MLLKSTSAAIALFTAGTSAFAADLTIEITDVRSGDGTIRVALHDGAAGFPSERTPIAVQAAPASTDGARFIFVNIAPGSYAATFFHDENGNEELDTNLVGFPTEGYGFSNGASGSFGPPPFAEAAFDVLDADLTVINSVAY